MRKRQTITKIIMFMLPAVLTVAAYSTYYDRLFSQPTCKNCDKFSKDSQQTNAFDLRKILDLIDQLRLSLAAKDAQKKYSARTPLDLALLQDKLEKFKSDYSFNNKPSNTLIENPTELLDTEKPQTIAKNDPEELKKAFYIPDEVLPNNEPYVSGPTAPTTTPPTYISTPRPEPVSECTVGVNCNPPPTECNSAITPGCYIPTDQDDGTDGSNGDGSHSTVPVPNSAYLLITGLIVVAISRFKKKTTHS